MYTRFISLATLLLLLPLAVSAQVQPARVVQNKPRTPEEQQQAFHLPDGFRIELVASDPKIINPINLAFGLDGSLFVTQSIEYPIPTPTGKKPRDVIYRIVDQDGDGVPEHVVTFASGLTIPIGVTPTSNSVIGYSIPKLLKFTDTDQDGRADARQTLFAGFGFDDTHGMISSLTWWIDGWVYGCHGFVNTSNVQGTDEQAITMVSGNTYRFRPDGSTIEHHAHGQVNPFGLCFDEWGNVFTADCHTRPATMLLRGAHYPRSPGDGLGFGPELMQHSHGSTGIAGIVYYAAQRFPRQYQGALFVGNPITGRINCDRLERDGSTYTAIEQPDFLTCDDPWFRPVDLKLAPDGSLYVADMYNAVIGHYEVPLTHPKRDRQHGRIWRITYGQDADFRHAPPHTVDNQVDNLASPNLVLRSQATHRLVTGPDEPVLAACRKALHAGAIDTQRAHSLWVLYRKSALTMKDIQTAAGDPSPLVRTHLVKVLHESATWTDAKQLLVSNFLADSDAFVRRAAVEALAKHALSESILPLLQLWERTDSRDTCLVHATKIAIRNALAKPAALRTYLANASASHQAMLETIVLGLPKEESAAFLLNRVTSGKLELLGKPNVVTHVVRYIGNDSLPIVWALAESLTLDEEDGARTFLAFQEGAAQRGINVPLALLDRATVIVLNQLASSDIEQVNAGIGFASKLKLTKAVPELRRLSQLNTPHPTARLGAVLAIEAINPPELPAIFFRIIDDPRELPIARQYTSEKLAARPDLKLRKEITARLSRASQLVAIGYARGLATDNPGITILLNAVSSGRISRRVLLDPKVNGLIDANGSAADAERCAALLADLPSFGQVIEQRVTALAAKYLSAKPDATQGKLTFRKLCASCHRLANEGEQVGPELDGVGLRGIGRLLEDILDPNRAIDAAYRATLIQTVGGQVINGLVTGRAGQVVTIVDATGQPRRIPVAEIEEQKKLSVSAMPANIVESLKEPQLFDLLAFLLSQQQERLNSSENSPRSNR